MNAHPYDREKPDILCASNFICMWPARTCGIEAVVEAWVMGEAAAGIGTNSVLVDCDASSEDASAPVRFAVCSFSSMFRLKAVQWVTNASRVVSRLTGLLAGHSERHEPRGRDKKVLELLACPNLFLGQASSENWECSKSDAALALSADRWTVKSRVCEGQKRGGGFSKVNATKLM